MSDQEHQNVVLTTNNTFILHWCALPGWTDSPRGISDAQSPSGWTRTASTVAVAPPGPHPISYATLYFPLTTEFRQRSPAFTPAFKRFRGGDGSSKVGHGGGRDP